MSRPRKKIRRAKGTAAAAPNGGMYRESDFERQSGRSGNLEPYRSAFRKDSARLIHSPAFRRLQGKTQLFPGLDLEP